LAALAMLEVLRIMGERLKLLETYKDARPPQPDAMQGLVPPAVLRTIRSAADEPLAPEDRDALVIRTLRQRGSEEIVACLVIKSGKVTVVQGNELALNIHYFGLGSHGIPPRR
jgi:hypothetical protein